MLQKIRNHVKQLNVTRQELKKLSTALESRNRIQLLTATAAIKKGDPHIQSLLDKLKQSKTSENKTNTHIGAIQPTARPALPITIKRTIAANKKSSKKNQNPRI